MINKIILALGISAFSCMVFADAQVIDDSQNYAYNQPKAQITSSLNNDNSVYVLSGQEKQNVHLLGRTEPDRSDQKLQLLLSKIVQLQQEMSELRGVVEVQTHNLEMAGLIKTKIKNKSQIVTEAKDKTLVQTPVTVSDKHKLDDKVIAAQSKNDDVEVVTSKIRRSDDPMDEQLNYVAAYEHVKSKHYQQAILAMQSFIKAYPDGPYAANAHYWLGELYLVKSQTNKAKIEFETIIKDFADSNKLASAQYKLGVTYEKLGNKDEARAQFIKVTEEFPGTAIARLARTKLS